MSHDPIQSYVDDLLSDGSDNRNWQSTCRLASLGGLRLALPQPYGDSLLGTASLDGSFQKVDIRPILFPPHHPALDQVVGKSLWACVPQLQVAFSLDIDLGLRQVTVCLQPCIADRTGRAWLVGIVPELEAAMIDPLAVAREYLKRFSYSG